MSETAPEPSHYERAVTALESANKQLGAGIAPENKPLAQTIATVGVGRAVLALVDELRLQREAADRRRPPGNF